jgi:hypothetical protein
VTWIAYAFHVDPSVVWTWPAEQVQAAIDVLGEVADAMNSK